MHGQAARKKLEKQAKEAEQAKRCACGNFCGDDGLCNACRTAKSAAPASGAFAPPARSKAAPSQVPASDTAGCVRQLIESCPADLPEDVVEYLADTAMSLVEEHDSPSALRQELEEAILPLLEEYEDVSDEDAAALCGQIVKAAFPDASPSAQAPASDLASNADCDTGDNKQFLFLVPNLLLMYGGSPEPLLRGATLELRRGHRYGVIGSNGSGKTTLMARIASKDIAGLPEELIVVHLRHETILQGVRPKTKVTDYVQMQNTGPDAASEKDMDQALCSMGFDNEELRGKAVLALSGGWQMRLALACATAKKANLLLLDEPTNHLDAEGVKWLVDFINTTCAGEGENGGAAMIVSHDPDFLDQVCTDMIHFSPSTQKGKLAYYPGTFSEFKHSALGGDEAEAERLLQTPKASSSGQPSLGLGPDDENRMAFPIPEKIGETSEKRKAPVVTLQKASFQYKGAPSPVLHDINAALTTSSRVGIVGKNGCGKSTLLGLLAGRLHPSAVDGDKGTLWWHKDLRLAYIAQHSLAHLGNHLDNTPLEYMQLRFRRGFDEETPDVGAKPLTKKEEEDMQKSALRHGKRGKPVEALLSRIVKNEGKEKECLYEVKWKGLGPGDNSFETVNRLKQLKAMKLVEDLNDKISSAWAGTNQRPLTRREVVQHFEPFGLSENVVCERKISMLSSGQKSKVALGAAFWTRPHMICLDEPTNYLDAEAVELLQKAIRSFRGGCAVVTHSEKFVQEVCNEIWEVAEGQITVTRKTE